MDADSTCRGDCHAGNRLDRTADASGVARPSTDVPGLGDGATSIAGRSLIVHADPDDHLWQPAGNCGKRVACAVIRTN
jgi:Cu-Zn family superoxide dismutase